MYKLKVKVFCLYFVLIFTKLNSIQISCKASVKERKDAASRNKRRECETTNFRVELPNPILTIMNFYTFTTEHKLQRQ